MPCELALHTDNDDRNIKLALKLSKLLVANRSDRPVFVGNKAHSPGNTLQFQVVVDKYIVVRNKHVEAYSTHWQQQPQQRRQPQKAPNHHASRHIHHTTPYHHERWLM
jgi:hypothetical protein